MKKICKNCQYFREESWCSNSKSVYFRFRKDIIEIDGINQLTRISLSGENTCPEFYERGKKATAKVRTVNKVLKKAKDKRNDKKRRS